MFRMLLTTTAIVAVMQTGAFAADGDASNMAKPTTVFTQDGKYERPVSQDGYFQAVAGQILANTLIGKSVYNNASDEGEVVGDINDIVIAPNGMAEAVIIGVGGFLGIGEKDVAIEFGKVNWVDRDGERWIVVDASKEQLEAAPAFERTVLAPKPMANAADTPATGDKMARNASETASGNVSNQEMMPVDMAAVSTEELIGARVFGGQQEDLGEVSEVIVSDSGSVEAFVVDVGGFLGIGEKPIAIGSKDIDFKQDADGNIVVFTPFTKEQLEQQAAYTREGYEKDRMNGALTVPNS